MDSIGSKNILCVDDEVTGLAVRRMILESQGYRVFAVENGPDALDVFSSHPIDLVVLDYRMPGMDGGQVAQEMKRRKPTVPIFMLSAYVDLPSEALAWVDKSVTKGEPPAVLLDSIAHLFRRSQKASPKSTAREAA